MIIAAEQGGGTGAVQIALEAADASVRKLRLLSGEITAIKTQLGGALTPAWQSPAGAAFTTTLSSQLTALQRLVDTVDASAREVAHYAQFLREKALSVSGVAESPPAAKGFRKFPESWQHGSRPTTASGAWSHGDAAGYAPPIMTPLPNSALAYSGLPCSAPPSFAANEGYKGDFHGAN